jgi:hypothetical protein
MKTKINTYNKIINSIMGIYPSYQPQIIISDFDHLSQKILVYESTRGQLETIRMLKEMRVSLYNYLAGKKIVTSGVSLYKDGIPKAFGPQIAKLIRSKSKDVIRIVLTFLLYSREIDAWAEPDISTIIETPTYTPEIRKEYKYEVDELLRRLCPTKPKKPEWENPHYTTKSSPMGIAMLMTKEELLEVKKSEKLYNSIITIGGPNLEFYMGYLIDNLDDFKHTSKPRKGREGRLRSIGVVKDTEGKSRLIAMADYWSQTCLFPLHTQILSVLKKIKMDLTFGQDIGPFGRRNQSYWSFDLTAATDRLPIFLYEDILESWFGKEYQEAWTHIMTGTEFHWKDSTINYNTGQPMGLYSSWALMALAHHVIVQYSARRVGFKNFSDYRILGDDIVIRDDLVAHFYAETIKSLGVKISPNKSLIGKTTFEFAKRFFYEEEEVSGFPINGWISACKLKWVDQLNIIETATKRGFIAFPQLVNMRSLMALQEWTGKDYGLRRKISRNILTHLSVYNPEHDYLIKEVAREWNKPLSCVTSISNFRRCITVQMANLLLQQLGHVQRITLKLVQDNIKFKDPKVTKYNTVSWVAMCALRRVYPKQKLHYEPMVQAINSCFNRSIEAADELADNNSSMGMFSNLEQITNYLKNADLRIPSTQVRDKSRKSERVLKLVSSMTVRSLMST